MYNLIQVRYLNNVEGFVDDVTLDELIESKRVSHFYRPAEDRWVDVSVEPVRRREEANKIGRFRRASDWEAGEEEEQEKKEKPRGILSKIFDRRKEHIKPKKQVSAQEWFEQGFVKLHTTDDCEGAVRAFARSIQLNPTYERAYVNRGLAYERLGNVQQAIEDYRRAIFVNPDDAKVYYLRGLAFKRLGMTAEAVADIKKAAGLRYRPAYDFLKSERIS
jgi:tetratricopeptide (TPR) repeat protein